MAEMKRFELLRRRSRPTGFRIRTLQPLGYISMDWETRLIIPRTRGFVNPGFAENRGFSEDQKMARGEILHCQRNSPNIPLCLAPCPRFGGQDPRGRGEKKPGRPLQEHGHLWRVRPRVARGKRLHRRRRQPHFHRSFEKCVIRKRKSPANPVFTGLFWSGRRESNPRFQLGKLEFCH